MEKEIVFKQSCLIRKNTPKLMDKLKYLGYKIHKLSETESRGNGILCNGKVAVGIPYNSQEFNLDEYLKNNPQIIDCGKNEDLFLAIASLRDDSDIYQWFVYDDKDDNLDERQILWFVCEDDDIRHDMWHDQAYLDCHKATVEELIEHFK